MPHTDSRSNSAIDPLTFNDCDSEIITDEGFPQLFSAISDRLPQYCLFPRDLMAMQRVIKAASREKWRVIPCGSGSKLSWGGLTRDIQALVSTRHLNKIIEHAVGDFTVSVEAGMKLADLQASLKAVDRVLPLDPAYPQEATIGGIIATADAGSWRQRYGGVRDLLLGISFLRADGELAKAGGRVVKNVAGYDLMKLFAGSYGTLGIITQATFRLYPLDEASGSIAITGSIENLTEAAKIVRNCALTPTAAELISASLARELELGEDNALLLRFQSIPASIDEQISQIERLAAKLNLKSQQYRGETEEKLWQRLTETIFPSNREEKITCKIGILPTAAVSFLMEVDRDPEVKRYLAINLSSGLGKMRLPPETSDRTLSQWRGYCQQNRGFLSILEGSIDLKQKIDPWGYNGNAIEVMRKIKQKFDPHCLLSPERFVGGI